MASKTIKMVFQFRRATAAEWAQYPDVVPAAGEPCFVTDKNILKIGDGETTFEKLEPINGVKADVAADGKSIVLEDNVFQLMGFDAAEVGAQPRKGENGLEWVVPSTETVEGLQTTVGALQTDVDALKKAVGTTKEGAATILDRVEAVEGAVDVLNGDSNVEGSVKQIVDEAINKFATDVGNDEVIDSYKELIDYVADHGSEAAAMARDITNLKGLVGTTSVEDQIAAAVADKVVAEEGKSLVADTLIAKLEGIEEEAQVNVIESIKVGDTLLSVVEKQVVIPIGAGLKGSDEINIAADGTLSLGTISFDKIVGGSSEIVMDGGGAAV